jgi:pimeloyl-ACP methyl ester carboxylesterase
VNLPDWLERMLPFRKSLISVEGRQMHVMESGPQEARAVLLLHGNPTWSFLWRKVALALAPSPLRLIMPDLIGLGLSEKPRDPSVHTLDFHSAQIAALIDALQLRSLIFVGQDWGGPIGIAALAATHVTLEGLVVCNTVLGPPRRSFRQTAFHRFSRLPIVSSLAFRWAQFPQAMLWSAQADRSSIRGDVARAYRWPLRAREDRVAPLALARMVPNGPEHPSIPGLRRTEAYVQAFRGPSAIVWGERDPILGRLRRRMENLLPHAKVTVTQAGHFLQEEVPLDIAQAVRHVAGA